MHISQDRSRAGLMAGAGEQGGNEGTEIKTRWRGREGNDEGEGRK